MIVNREHSNQEPTPNSRAWTARATRGLPAKARGRPGRGQRVGWPGSGTCCSWLSLWGSERWGGGNVCVGHARWSGVTPRWDCGQCVCGGAALGWCGGIVWRMGCRHRQLQISISIGLPFVGKKLQGTDTGEGMGRELTREKVGDGKRWKERCCVAIVDNTAT